MKLKDFIEKFVCKNTLIRLWTPITGGHEMIARENKDVCMEWEILSNKEWKYIVCLNRDRAVYIS